MPVHSNWSAVSHRRQQVVSGWCWPTYRAGSCLVCIEVRTNRDTQHVAPCSFCDIALKQKHCKGQGQTKSRVSQPSYEEGDVWGLQIRVENDCRSLAVAAKSIYIITYIRIRAYTRVYPWTCAIMYLLPTSFGCWEWRVLRMCFWRHKLSQLDYLAATRRLREIRSCKKIRECVKPWCYQE